MDAEQQNKCIAFLLALAFDSDTSKETMQKAANKLLGELPTEEVSKAAGTPILF